MPENRNINTSKSKRVKSNHIASLKDNLMSKFTSIPQTKSNFNPPFPQPSKYSSSLSHQDLELISFDTPKKETFMQKPHSILEKAKQITRINKQQIQYAKKTIKKSTHESDGMFLTGCGLYRSEEQPIHPTQDFQSVDLNDALKFLVSHEKDDLEELRRMIKKTNSNIKEYSHEVTKTTGQVQNAADLFGRDFNIDLKVKISRCKPIERQFETMDPSQNEAKRKISTSGSRRNKNIF